MGSVCPERRSTGRHLHRTPSSKRQLDAEHLAAAGGTDPSACLDAVELALLALADADIVLGERRALALRVHHDGILAVYGEAVGELVEALEGLPGSRVSTAAAW